MEETRRLKIAALYIRVSTDRQEELSPESQKDKLLEYASSQGYYVPKEYIFWELGISGRKADKRPEFQRMIALAKSREHPIDAILVWKYSRFARNQEESIVYKSMLKKDNVEVISVSEPISDDMFGKLIERIIEWMDEYYSIRLAGDVFRGMAKKAELGGYQCSPPLGYKIASKGEPPVIDPANAEIIKLIFDQYVNEGKSIYAISVHLNELGLKTKSGSSFQKRSVEYILKNITYCGYTRWNMTNNENNRAKDESDWIIRKGNFEPIISEDIFNAAQERMEKEYAPRKAKPIYNQKHWLSGMVKCSACGRSLSVGCAIKKTTGKKYYYLQCYGYHKALCTVSHRISLLKFEPIVLTAIKDAFETGNFNYEVAKRNNKKNNGEILSLQLSKLSERGARMKEAYLAGIDTLEEYRANKALLEAEKQRLHSLLAEQPSADPGAITKSEMINRIKDAYSILSSDNYSYDEKAAALRRIVHKIVYQKEEECINLYFLYL